MHRRAPSFRLALLSLLTVGLLLGAAAPATAQSVGGCEFPHTRTDATGTAVTVESAPDRVVALHPSAAQTMWEIGARDDVVGMPVGPYTSDLEGYEEPANVVAADGYTVEVETVVELEPDLVLAPNVTPADTVASLRRAGLTVYHFRKAQTIDDVYAKTELTGQLTGHCDGAEARAAWMRNRIERVREAVRDEPKPLVVYPLGGGVVPGEGTFLDELVTTAGGRNLAVEAGISGYGQLSAEVVVARDPQWLILNEDLPRSAIQMDAYERTTAIRENQTVRVDPNQANQPAPRVVYAVETIARALHPEAMAEANESTETPTPSPETVSLEAEQSTSTASEETTSAGQPGFGVPVGLLALLIVLLAGSGRR